MFDKLFGLPAHPLLIHAPIVLLPIIAAVSIALAAKPGWRRRASWWWPASLGAIFVMLFAAKESGEALIDAYDRLNGVGSVPIDRHAQLADQTQLITFVWLLVVIGVTVFDFVRRRNRPVSDLSAAGASEPSVNSAAVAQGLSILAAVIGVIATVWLIRTGHEGADLHWGSFGDQLFPD